EPATCSTRATSIQVTAESICRRPVERSCSRCGNRSERTLEGAAALLSILDERNRTEDAHGVSRFDPCGVVALGGILGRGRSHEQHCADGELSRAERFDRERGMIERAEP